MHIDIRSTMRQGRFHCDFNPVQPVAGTNHEFLTAVLGGGLAPHYLSRQGVYHYDSPFLNYRVVPASLVVQASHLAFAGHNGLTIRPDIIWYMITSQVAEYVKQNADQFAHLFTATPGEKQEIAVRDDSLVYGRPDNNWGATIGLFYKPLRDAVTAETADLFLARFTTTGPEDAVATLVNFMDAASPYYEYRVNTLCGIPGINLLGDKDDYDLIIQKMRRLARKFPALYPYFDALEPIMANIALSFITTDINFWGSIYRFEQESGMHFVTGWLNAFQIYEYTENGPKMKESFGRTGGRQGYGATSVNEFPSHLACVPFNWQYYERLIPMKFVAGPLGIDYVNGYFDARLGFGVYEVKG